MAKLKTHRPDLVIFVLVAAAYLWGMFAPLDRVVMDSTYEVVRRDASGTVVLVEVDGKSLRELDVWPWVRSYHAKVLDRLIDAGAWSVAFDIDFSSRTVATQDRALADAIQRASGKVTLPVFLRNGRDENGNPVNTFAGPSSIFGRNAMLASVNVILDPDGKVRRYPTSEQWRGQTIPSLATQLAADPDTSRPSFYVDYGIRPESIPRLSFVDVMNGRFERGMVDGKVVIIGATALELGDRIPAPNVGVMAGPVLQALAYESIAQGRTIQRVSPWVTLVVALMIIAFLSRVYKTSSLRRSGVIACAILPTSFIVAAAVQWALPISIDISAWWAVVLLSFAARLVVEVDRRTLRLFAQRITIMHRRAMMNSVVDDSFDGIIITDENGIIRLFNPMASRMTGIASRDALSRPISSIVPEFEQHLKGQTVAHANGMAEQIFEPGVPHEIAIERQDGGEFVAELVISSSRLRASKRNVLESDLNHTVYILTFRDISERKRIEAAERKAMEHAVAASRAKSEFLANVSHELRTPLNAIIGFSEMITNEMFGPIGQSQYAEYVVDIHGSALHLLDVINDILDMSKIEAGEMQLMEQATEVEDVVRSCLRLINERAKSAGLTVSSDVSTDVGQIYVDPRLVRQILLNLLSNAVKFTPAGGTVTVSCGLREEGEFFFAVKDTGIGMSEEDMERAQLPFGQADASLERKYEGTGLGLPLVKSMTELHGGTVELESEVGVGTTVTILFGSDRVIPPGREADFAPADEPEAANA